MESICTLAARRTQCVCVCVCVCIHAGGRIYTQVNTPIGGATDIHTGGRTHAQADIHTVGATDIHTGRRVHWTYTNGVASDSRID